MKIFSLYRFMHWYTLMVSYCIHKTASCTLWRSFRPNINISISKKFFVFLFLLGIELLLLIFSAMRRKSPPNQKWITSSKEILLFLTNSLSSIFSQFLCVVMLFVKNYKCAFFYLNNFFINGTISLYKNEWSREFFPKLNIKASETSRDRRK